MNRYEQSTGRWYDAKGLLLGVGFSGYDPDPSRKGEPGEGVNHPELDGVKNVGPLPCGRYRILSPFTHPTTGAYSMRLDPLPGNQMKGRGNFLIHGDSRLKPGTGSHGCIIFPRAIRELIWATGDRELEVVPGAPAVV